MAEIRVISSTGGHGVIFRDGDGFRGLGTRQYCWIEEGVWDPYRTEDTEFGTAAERARAFVRGSTWKILEDIQDTR